MKIQVALDFTELSRALKLANEVKDSVEILEAGTPLIKAEGIRAVAELKRKFPDKIIVADLKIMDTGSLEAELAFKAGADIVTVEGAAATATIEDALETARKNGKKIMVDCLNVGLTRIADIEKLGPDYLCMHTGIDEQNEGKSLLEVMKAGKFLIPLAIAGGINEQNISQFAALNPEILIIGGALTRTSEPETVVKKLRKLMVKGSNDNKPEPRQSLSGLRTSHICDAMNRQNGLELPRVVINLGKETIFGHARTVKVLDGDWGKSVEIISKCRGDEIPVIETNGKKAVFGGLAASSCKISGVKAVIVFGGVRDREEIEDSKVVVLADHLNPVAGEPHYVGEFGAKITRNGVEIREGDLIVIDSTGIAVVPREKEKFIINKARMVMEGEERIRKEILQSKKTLHDVLGDYKRVLVHEE